MKVVGDHLAQEALRRIEVQPEADLFARAAIGRFYYASFLIARSLMTYTTNKPVIGHAALPAHLEVLFRKRLMKDAASALKAKVLTGKEYIDIRTLVNQNCKPLCELLQRGRDLREIADYEPEVLVAFNNASFDLGGIKGSTAAHWPTAADQHCRQLRAAWDRVYGV